jgi:asparagine synthase (glutamine-hydrolysing)
LHKAPNSQEFDIECRRLVNNIHFFDVLRSDRTISCHGLETRTPFLDKDFVTNYFKIDKDIRCHSGSTCEKYLIRKAFEGILPDEIIWRTKEAFSDGVSGDKKAWFEVINDYLLEQYPEYVNINDVTIEMWYYRHLFDTYNYKQEIIPYFWMPRFVDAKDASARTLKIYSEVKSS